MYSYYIPVMKINIIGIEPQFKIYKISESIDGMLYIGKTKQPLRQRMYQHQKNPQLKSDEHFANVGWDNVVVDIIDVANDDNALHLKETEHIMQHSKLYKNSLLNKNSIIYERKIKGESYGPYSTDSLAQDKDANGLPSFYAGKRIWDGNEDVNKFTKDNELLINSIPDCIIYVSECLQRYDEGKLTNCQAKEQIMDFLVNVCKKKKYVLC